MLRAPSKAECAKQGCAEVAVLWAPLCLVIAPQGQSHAKCLCGLPHEVHMYMYMPLLNKKYACGLSPLAGFEPTAKNIFAKKDHHRGIGPHTTHTGTFRA